ncbi:MAG TPA: CoA transferase [Quisquiliibacterium sp.]|nr:CoA transferase [Quisquiliibacterium sp.]HPA91603.1 CoA transferase [Quisquiliibacterium sp.]
MSHPILTGLRVVEFSAFVAAPLSGLTLAQLGADVIRVDPIGGNIDTTRMPVNGEGKSLYWASLNKGKRSVEIDVRSPQGRKVLQDMITAPGPGGGIFVTNLSVDGELAYEALKARRADVIMVQLIGSSDGGNALDYTVNCAAGFPMVTGDGKSGPVNHVLPAWDLVAGLTLATGILAAERHRRETGEGQFVRLALSDVAFAAASNLGYLAEVEVNDADRKADGNFLYGAYGDAFDTADGRRVMALAITDRQWKVLVRAIGMEDALKSAADALGHSLDTEVGRYNARELISAFFRPWFAKHTLEQIAAKFTDRSLLWGPYRTFRQMLAEDPRVSEANPMFTRVEHPVGRFLTAGTPLAFSESERVPAGVGPVLGQDTDAVLKRVLGMDDAALAALRDAGVIGGRV